MREPRFDRHGFEAACAADQELERLRKQLDCRRDWLEEAEARFRRNRPDALGRWPSPELVWWARWAVTAAERRVADREEAIRAPFAARHQADKLVWEEEQRRANEQQRAEIAGIAAALAAPYRERAARLAAERAANVALQDEADRERAYGSFYHIKRWEQRTPGRQREITDYLRRFLRWMFAGGHVDADPDTVAGDDLLWDISPPSRRAVSVFVVYAQNRSSRWRELMCAALRLYFLHHDASELFRMVERINRRGPAPGERRRP